MNAALLTASDSQHGHNGRPIDRIALALAFIAAKPLLRFIRSHGHPCRFESTGDHGAIRVAGTYAAIGKRYGQWEVCQLALTGDAETDLETVREWLGY